MDYRARARELRDQARTRLEVNTAEDILLAALLLRMCLECFVYEKVKNYQVDLPDKDLEQWQPRQLLKKFLEVEPFADMGGNVAISLSAERPSDSSEYTDLGTERSIKLRELQRHYDSLGAYLHIPTKAQLKKPKKLEPSYLKNKCEEVLSIVNEVLESNLFTINLAQRTNFECIRCERQIALRLPLNGDNAVRACKHCGVTYSVSLTHCVPIIDTVTCNLNGCNGKTKVYRADLDEGFQFNCEKCGKLYRFELGFVHRTQKTAD